MLPRPIEEWWHDLDAEIHSWFAENPGCLILPRTVANTLCKVADCHDDQDRHGRLELSVRDREFIRTQVQFISHARSNSSRSTNK